MGFLHNLRNAGIRLVDQVFGLSNPASGSKILAVDSTNPDAQLILVDSAGDKKYIQTLDDPADFGAGGGSGDFLADGSIPLDRELDFIQSSGTPSASADATLYQIWAGGGRVRYRSGDDAGVRTAHTLANFDDLNGLGDFFADGSVPMSDVFPLEDNPIQMIDITTPSGDPEAGKFWLYLKADKNLYIKDDAGTETQVTGAGGGSGDFLANGTVPMTGNLNLASYDVLGAAAYHFSGDGTVMLTAISGKLFFQDSDAVMHPVADPIQTYLFAQVYS